MCSFPGRRQAAQEVNAGLVGGRPNDFRRRGECRPARALLAALSMLAITGFAEAAEAEYKRVMPKRSA